MFTQSEKFAMLAKALPHVTPQVKTVVYWGPDSAADIAAAKATGVSVYSFHEFLELGRANSAPPIPPKAEDLCTIMYTSGTTGDPKVSINGLMKPSIFSLRVEYYRLCCT